MYFYQTTTGEDDHKHETNRDKYVLANVRRMKMSTLNKYSGNRKTLNERDGGISVAAAAAVYGRGDDAKSSRWGSAAVFFYNIEVMKLIRKISIKFK